MSQELKFNIEQIAELARLSLKPEEKAKLARDLQNILGYVDQLRELNTDRVEPTSHVLKIENVFRPDKVKSSQIFEEVLKHAPKREGSFFKVPKIIEGA